VAISVGCVRLLRHVVPRNDKKGMLIAMTGGDMHRNDKARSLPSLFHLSLRAERGNLGGVCEIASARCASQ
jgi:hypothetical protein